MDEILSSLESQSIALPESEAEKSSMLRLLEGAVHSFLDDLDGGANPAPSTQQEQQATAVSLPTPAPTPPVATGPTEPAEQTIKDAAMENETFASLMTEAQGGSMTAVWRIIEVYEPHIQRVVRRRISQTLRSKFDTMDFVQMVWKSFFDSPERMQKFASPAQLFGFLSRMAQNKVETERRRTKSQKYDVSKETQLDETRVVAGDTPSELAIAKERWDRMLSSLPENHRKIVKLRLEGMTFEQISDTLSLSERTARRVLERLTTQLGHAS